MAIGVGDDDQRHFVGFACANSKSYASWRGFLQQRGVHNVRLVTSDALGGRPGSAASRTSSATYSPGSTPGST
ncbi:transposase [Atopobium sp. oral taxon 416]|nr:transposase [Atopobium sp. oral taxon 416]